MPEPPPPPPPPSLPPKELPINRYKFIWRVLMISNLALGGYMFIGVKKRDRGDRGTLHPKSVETGAENHKPAVEVPSVPAATPTTTPTTTPATTTTTSETWDM